MLGQCSPPQMGLVYGAIDAPHALLSGPTRPSLFLLIGDAASLAPPGCRCKREGPGREGGSGKRKTSGGDGFFHAASRWRVYGLGNLGRVHVPRQLPRYVGGHYECCRTVRGLFERQGGAGFCCSLRGGVCVAPASTVNAPFGMQVSDKEGILVPSSEAGFKTWLFVNARVYGRGCPQVLTRVPGRHSVFSLKHMFCFHPVHSVMRGPSFAVTGTISTIFVGLPNPNPNEFSHGALQ